MTELLSLIFKCVLFLINQVILKENIFQKLVSVYLRSIFDLQLLFLKILILGTHLVIMKMKKTLTSYFLVKERYLNVSLSFRRQYQDFLEDLEEDEAIRKNVNIYRGW